MWRATGAFGQRQLRKLCAARPIVRWRSVAASSGEWTTQLPQPQSPPTPATASTAGAASAGGRATSLGREEAGWSAIAALGASDAEKAELMRRISAMIEENPALAGEFAKKLSALAAERFATLCAEEAQAGVQPPSRTQLKQACMAAALPFFGFGFLDNAIMILFGDIIDVTLCASLGFSTMAAAALGNTLSDGIGVYSGAMVEDSARACGWRPPPLSRAQQDMAVTKRWERWGQLVGITVGCLLGMLPLLFINTKAQEAHKREKMLEHMYEHAVSAIEDMLGAEAAMILMVDYEKGEANTVSASSRGQEFQFRTPLGVGITGQVVQSGRFMNVGDVRRSKYYTPAMHDDWLGTGMVVNSLLAMPIFGFNADSGNYDKVVGIVEVLNKKAGGTFSERDEDALAALCSHIATSLSFVHGEENGFDETLSRCARALKTKGMRINMAQNERFLDLYVSVLREITAKLGSNKVELLTVDCAEDEACVLASSFQTERHRGSERLTRKISECPAMAKAISCGTSCVDETEEGTMLCSPLFDRNGEVIAALTVEERKGKRFSENESRMLTEAGQRLLPSLEGAGSSLMRYLGELRSS